MLDRKSFHKAVKLKYTEVEFDARVSKTLSQWEEYLCDPDRHPFKMITVDGKDKVKEIINDEDGKLKGLWKEYGEQAFNAVRDALLQINEYNPSELRNFDEGRKATLKEGVLVLIKECEVKGWRELQEQSGP